MEDAGYRPIPIPTERALTWAEAGVGSTSERRRSISEQPGAPPSNPSPLLLFIMSRRIIGRFTTVPTKLFRVQTGVGVKLRLEAAAIAAGRQSFDVSGQRDGLIWPRDPEEPLFLGPNGMSMRPLGEKLALIMSGYSRGRVFEVPEGTPLPSELVLLHEHSDHYALQPTACMTLEALNAALTGFLDQPTVRKFKSLKSFYEIYPDMSPRITN